MQRFLKDEQGQDLVEFALLLAFVMFTTTGLAFGFQIYVAAMDGITKQNLAAATAAIR